MALCFFLLRERKEVDWVDSYYYYFICPPTIAGDSTNILLNFTIHIHYRGASIIKTPGQLIMLFANERWIELTGGVVVVPLLSKILGNWCLGETARGRRIGQKYPDGSLCMAFGRSLSHVFARLPAIGGLRDADGNRLIVTLDKKLGRDVLGVGERHPEPARSTRKFAHVRPKSEARAICGLWR